MFLPLDAKKTSLQPSLKVVEPAARTVSSSSEAAPQEEPGAEKQILGRPKKKKWWSKDSRAEITGAELEAAILEAVKKTAPCEDFIGVIVGRKTPKSHLDPNWEVQGAKFGKADRKLAEETLASVVQRMQKELVLAEERDAPPHGGPGCALIGSADLARPFSRGVCAESELPPSIRQPGQQAPIWRSPAA